MPYFDQFCSIQQAGFTMPTSYQLMLVIGNLSGVHFYTLQFYEPCIDTLWKQTSKLQCIFLQQSSFPQLDLIFINDLKITVWLLKFIIYIAEHFWIG